MKTLLDRNKTSSINIDKSFKFTVFYDNNDIKLIISLLAEKLSAYNFWVKYLAKRKNFTDKFLKRLRYQNSE